MPKFNKMAISVFAPNNAVREPIGRPYRSVEEAKDDSPAPQFGLFPADRGCKAKRRLPLFSGGLAGEDAVVACGGALNGTIAATLLGSAPVARLDSLRAHATGTPH